MTLKLPNTQLTFYIVFAVEFHFVKFDGSEQLDLPDSPCQGDFCKYCPYVSEPDDEGNVYDDYGDLMTLPYRDHCNQWHIKILFYVHEGDASL